MRDNIKSLAVVALVLLSSVLAVGAVSAAGDSTVTDVEVVNETVSVDSDTEALRVIGENLTNDTVSVEVYSVNDSDGTETSVFTGTLNTSSSATDSVEYSGVNSTEYSEYRVVAMGDNASDSVEVNRVQVVATGGGAFGLSGTGSTAAVVVGLGAALALVMVLRD